MRRLLRPAAVAFAFANLYLLFLSGPLVSPQHQLLFHMPASPESLLGAVLLNLLLVTAALWLLLWWARDAVRSVVVWAALLLSLPCVLLGTVAVFAGKPLPSGVLRLGGLVCGVAFAAVLVRRRALAPGFGRVRPGLETVFGFLALSGVLILGQLLWLTVKTRGLGGRFIAQATPLAAGQAVGQPPRVVWIVLDELSYRQLYGHRYPGLHLPNFDRLAAEAVVLPDAVATAQFTRIALPSLMTGEALSATAPTSDQRHLLLHPRGAHRWSPLRPEETVFGDSLRSGLPTGVAGWYEPYCRLLPAVLDRCFWSYRDAMPGRMSPTAPVWWNVLAPWREGLERLRGELRLGPGPAPEGALDVDRHRADFQALVEAGDRLLTAQRAGLILLHMPVPHPWGFYDRRTGRFADHRTSYLDNLALADRYLGHLRALLEAEGTWENTDVVIMGDHGWRVDQVWRRSGFWTPEEEAASRGAASIDSPAVIVKLHGEHRGAVGPAGFRAVRTRALVQALLRRQIATPEQLDAWVSGL